MTTFRRSIYTAIGVVLLGIVAGHADAAETPTFENKKVTMTISNTVGGGMDAAARSVAKLMTRYLPGNPTIIVENRPGGGHVVGNNWFVAMGKRDGTDLLFTASTVIEQFNRGDPQVKFNPQQYEFIGAVKYTDTLVFVRQAAFPQIYDAGKPPAVVGDLDGIRTHVALTVMAKRHLGHNFRWVVGYPGGKELSLALQKGEIDVYGTKNEREIEQMTKGPDGAKPYVQSARVRRTDFPNTPTIWELLADKNVPALDMQAFEFWLANEPLDHIVALPPETDPKLVAVVRDAWDKAVKDPDFASMLSQAMGPGIRAISGSETKDLIVKATAVTPEARKRLREIRIEHGLPTGD